MSKGGSLSECATNNRIALQRGSLLLSAGDMRIIYKERALTSLSRLVTTLWFAFRTFI